MDDALTELAELIGARERLDAERKDTADLYRERLKGLDKRIARLASRLRGEDEDGQLDIEG